MRAIAFIYGIIFVIAGILGFYPDWSPNNMLLGYFHVNAMHNLVHLISGIIGLWVGFSSRYASQLFFRIFGIVYVIIAILGLYTGPEPIFGIIANNMADVGLHFIVGIIALIIGFGCSCKERA